MSLAHLSVLVFNFCHFAFQEVFTFDDKDRNNLKAWFDWRGGWEAEFTITLGIEALDFLIYAVPLFEKAPEFLVYKFIVMFLAHKALKVGIVYLWREVIVSSCSFDELRVLIEYI